MITNERQRRITQAEIRRFERAIARAEADGPSENVHPRLHEAMIEGLGSQLDDLREELNEYEALRGGKIKTRVFSSLLDFPSALIEGRIAGRLTQKELAAKLGIPEQQIQRYEKTRYAGATIERLQEVAEALRIKIEKTVEYDVKGRSKAGGAKRARPAKRRRPAYDLAESSVSRTSASASRGSKRGKVASRKTGKAAASVAGKTLASGATSKTKKRAAASGVARAGGEKGTRKKAASAAGKSLASKSSSKATKRKATSALSPRSRKKR
jgi:transcriptional regulator with XRE-family HTH domain